MNMKRKWTKAQTLEPVHWLVNKEKIASSAYQAEVNKRAEHILNNISVNCGVPLPGSNLLEIGGGATPLAIFSQGSAVTLVDPLMDFYKDTFPSVFPNECELVQSRAEELPFADNSFDVLITRNTLDHVEDVVQCLIEMKRVLKPGGAAYIGMNVFAGVLLLYKTINKDPEHPYTFSRNSFESLISNYFDFKDIIYDDPINGNHFVENEDPVWYKSFLRNIFLKMNNYKIVEIYAINDK